MPTTHFYHNITSFSTYRPLTLELRISHAIEIDGSIPEPTEIQSLSSSLLREADFGGVLALEVSCVVDCLRVAANRLHAFPFVSNVVKQLQEVRGIAA
jgi:hypothetical protein